MTDKEAQVPRDKEPMAVWNVRLRRRDIRVMRRHGIRSADLRLCIEAHLRELYPEEYVGPPPMTCVTTFDATAAGEAGK